MQKFSAPIHCAAASLAAVLVLSGCTVDREYRPGAGVQMVGPNGLPSRSPRGNGAVSIKETQAERYEQTQVIQAQENHDKKVEVEFPAKVAKLLPDDTKGLPHQRFLVELTNGTRILVAHDTKLAPYVPLAEGDFVRLHGEYIWNEKGGVVHWTHHSPNGHHEPGWIEYNGQRYQ